MGNFLLFFSFILFSVNNLFAQKVNHDEASYSLISKQIEKQLLDKAYKGIYYTEYEEARYNYSELLRNNPIDVQNNYAMAVILYSNFQQPKSIPYFENVLRYSKDTLTEVYFFLANSYHLSGNYDKALQNFTIYQAFLKQHRSVLPKAEEENAKNDIFHRMEMCENGKQISVSGKSPLIKEGKKITISSIGNNINTPLDDFGAVFSSDDSTLFFTSKHKDNGNIYFSRFENNRWSPVKNIGWPINTSSYESVISSSSNGKRIYFYRSGIKEGTVYYSDYLNNHWNFPNFLLNKYEADYTFKDTRIFSFALTADKSELFIISDKQGGAGGKDIYISKRIGDSTWSFMENLGPAINTKYDEVALSLSPDGNTMYFSSNGSKSIGGFDVFVTYRKDGQWSEPLNLGIPINTPGDDLFFSFLHNSNRASYSSSAYTATNNRDLNIYYIDFCDDVIENTVKGLALGVPKGTITVTDAFTKGDEKKCSINDGKYSIDLKVGKRYNFVFEIEGIEPVHIEVKVPEPDQCKRYDIYQEISYSKPGDTLKFKSALLDIDYENAHPDLAGYPVLLAKEDKGKLRNYSEKNLLTYPAEILKPTITTVIYDTISGNIISKVSFSDTLLNSDKGKIKEIYDNEIQKASSSITTKEITTFAFSNILFDFDKSKIKEKYKAELDKAVEFLNEVKPDSQVKIAGYTDSKGNQKHNIILSRQRANAVAKYLIAKKINKNRITITGYGEKNPIAPNKNLNGTDNVTGRAKNRRTEIVIK